jgi:mannose/fructose/N-acetylgalactosamine-specific phosphotransferase system component IIC
MSRNMSKRARRTGVVLNYVALVLIIAFVTFLEYGGRKPVGITGLAISLGVFFVTLFQVYGRTGLWRFVHTPARKLDEREIQVIYRSLQYAYGAYAVICLVYIFVLSLAIRFSLTLLTPQGHFSFGMVVLFGLIYLSHVLPASIIAWTESALLLNESDELE